MKLWILKPVEVLPDYDPWEGYYDMAWGFVARAKTEQDARALAAEHSGDERDAWFNPAYATCEVLSDVGTEEMILRDFHAG